VSGPSQPSFARRLRHLVGALVCLLLLVQAGPGAAGPEQTKKELQEARARAEELTKQLTAAQARRDALQAQIHQLTIRISQLTAQLEVLREAKDEVEKEQRRIKRDIVGLQDSLDERARSAYIDGPATGLELVLEADSLTDLSDRLGFLQILQREDSDMALGLETQRDQLVEYEGQLEEYEAEVARLAAQLRPQRAELTAAWAEQEALIEDTRAAREEALALVERLGKKLKAQLAAAAAAAAAAATPVGSAPPVSANGPLFWCPVDQPRSYVDTFGAPRPGGRTHQGNDIFAPTGTPIRAPFAGTAQNGYDGLGGIVVHVYAPNGDYVYNAHLSQHASVDGQHVEPGDLIGYVGNTGNAVGTSPHDHFEYHPGGGYAVSPYPYLNEVCGVNGTG
jgi:peptidoglycan hydrolase CwlO-like protein